jgi:NAD(P)-dependent dehydrogenase (short-subunit alcohol dehydrogenase family)
MTEFAGQVALVTGAATGNGEAIARRLHARGARLVVTGHDLAGLQRLLEDIDPGGDRSRALEADVRDPQAMEHAVSLAVQAFGGLHLACNNAGLPGPQGTPIEALSLEDWRTVLDTDLTGMFI